MFTTAHTTEPDLAIAVPLHFREPAVVDMLTGFSPPFREFFIGQRIKTELDGTWSEIEVIDFAKHRRKLTIRDWRDRMWTLAPWCSAEKSVSVDDLGVNTQEWVILAGT